MNRQIEDYLNSALIDAVIMQIKEDLAYKEEEAICELLSFIPKENLINYLPEEQWENFK